MVSASHILKKASSDEEFKVAEEQIQAIRERLVDGEDFVKCVQEESDDGGNDEIGNFRKGRMVPSLKRRLFHGSRSVE